MSVEKSVIVQGKSIDEALQRASVLLHASTADLAHEVLQQGLVDPKGVVRIPYKLRVLPIVSAPERLDDLEWPEEIFTPPFSHRQLLEWTNEQFIQALQNAIALQPESNREPSQKRKVLSTPPLEIKGPLNAVNGSIFHDGDVIVNGSISKGVTINAAGAIKVCGDVEVSQLEAGNDIEIAGGMLGIARSSFGTITCHFAQGAYIECKKNLVIIESSFHSNLTSGSVIDVGSAIIGGICTAPLGINAKIVGSETGVITKLFAGSNNLVREEADSVRRQASQLVTKLSEATKTVKELEPTNSGKEQSSVEDRLRLWYAMSEMAKLNDRLVTLSRRKNMLLASIDQNRSARIKVSDKVHPQTQIEIDDVGMTVKKLTQYVTFSKDYEAGALRLTSFK